MAAEFCIELTNLLLRYILNYRLPHAHIVFRLENAPDHKNIPQCIQYIEEHITTSMPELPILEGHKENCVCTSCNELRKNNICASCSPTPCEPRMKCTSTLCRQIRYATLIRKAMIHKCYSTENGGCQDKYGNCKRGYSTTNTTMETCFDSRGFPIYKRPEIKDLMVVPHNKEIVLEVILVVVKHAY
jgi:hypothetical protein